MNPKSCSSPRLSLCPARSHSNSSSVPNWTLLFLPKNPCLLGQLLPRPLGFRVTSRAWIESLVVSLLVPSALLCPDSDGAGWRWGPFCHISICSEGSASSVLSNWPFWVCLLALGLFVWFFYLLLNFAHLSSTMQRCFGSQNRSLWLLDPEIAFVNIFVQTLFPEVSLSKRYKVIVFWVCQSIVWFSKSVSYTWLWVE